MKRSEALGQIQDTSILWDVIVIGGGATGLGCAVESASRRCRALLLERADFASATSSRSTKLIHGGFRYLKQGNVSLVRHSLRERGLLLHNAPHLVHRLAFVIPNYHWWERPYYGLGLGLYDRMAGRLGLGRSKHLTLQETLDALPTLAPKRLRGGIQYFDGQFDDARLAICLAQTLHDLGGVALNYVAAQDLIKEQGRIAGVVGLDLESGKEHRLRARCVINATGIFTDAIRRLDQPQCADLLTVSQGSHLVLPRSFLPGDCALMIPKTDDGRVLFAIPWHDRTVVGTTDIPMPAPVVEPKPLPEEQAFLLEHTRRYLSKEAKSSNILSVYSGLRPLVTSGKGKRTSKLSRDHTIHISDSGLVTITGGKWTTYRQMAQETIDAAARVAGLDGAPSRTETLRLHGWTEAGVSAVAQHERPYGSDISAIQSLAREIPEGNQPIHPRLPYSRAAVVWAIREEMARTVADVLSRRTRALLLDARASIEAAPWVAQQLASEFGRDEAWARDQIKSYTELAQGYLPMR